MRSERETELVSLTKHFSIFSSPYSLPFISRRVALSLARSLALSQGSRVLSHLSEFMTELFQPLPESGLPTDSSLPICGSLTFIHGEMDLVDFITIKYPIFRQYCNLMTAYTDSADQALLLAEVLTGRLMMGKNPEAFFVDPFAKNLGVEQGDLDVVKEARGEYLNLLENRERGSIGRLRKRSTTEQTEIDGLRKTQLADLRSSDGVGASTAVSVPLASSSSEDPKFKRNTKWREISKLDKEHVKMWLDMDVIDNSFLDTNTGAVRHSIFVLNKSLIDDIQVGVGAVVIVANRIQCYQPYDSFPFLVLRFIGHYLTR